MKQLFPFLAAAGIAALTGAALSAQEAYTIPDDLTPVSEWRSGFSAEQAEAFRQSYQASDIFTGNDRTAFAFLNLSEVVPTGVVPRGGPIAPLERAPMEGVEDIVASSELGEMPLGALMADPRSRVQALAVIHEGKVVYESYPGMPSDMRHLWSSSAKTISGLLTHQLAEEGLIDLQAKVSDYLDFTAGSPIGEILVEDVLHMRTGIDYEENQANRTDPDHPVSWAFAAALSERGVPAGPSLKEIMVDIPASDPPDTVYGYSTFNTETLIFIIEEVTGKPWNWVVSDRIWTKAGMEGDGLVALSPRGEVLGGGIFAGSLMDFARYGLLFAPSWQTVAEERVVSEGYFDAVQAAAEPSIYLDSEFGRKMVSYFGEEDAPIGGSYQWDAVFEDGDLYKSGLLGQGLYVSPETDTVVVWFSTTWQNIHPMTAYSRAIVNELFRAQ